MCQSDEEYKQTLLGWADALADLADDDDEEEEEEEEEEEVDNEFEICCC